MAMNFIDVELKCYSYKWEGLFEIGVRANDRDIPGIMWMNE